MEREMMPGLDRLAILWYIIPDDAGWSSPVARRAQSAESTVNTKQVGDIAEQSAILRAMKFGWGILKPLGDRLPYDLVFDVDGTLVKVQVKSAWFDVPSGNYVVDTRRTKTNRRMMLREMYTERDFDFAIIYIEPLDLFYVMPVEMFIGYGSEIHFVEADRRQRKPRSFAYRDAWCLILQWAARKEISV